MGGGDLNLKKSWHPNTMKNMERVWKAEQKDTEEKKRIAELQREIVAERSKEEMQKFAEDMGVVKKKDDVKLEWMYKGPSQSVNHEEYLLGKAIDRNFEKQCAEQKGLSSQDEESLPGALRQAKSSMFSEQVDIARKLNEDPLMAIRQRAVEKAKQLYNNPVKMKQIQKMAAAKSSEDKKHKKDKKKKKKSKKSSKKDELDAFLTEKLKEALKDRELLRKLKKKSHHTSSDCSSSSSSSDNSDSDENEGTQRHYKQSANQESHRKEVSCPKNQFGRSQTPPSSKSDRRQKYYDSNREQRDTRKESKSLQRSNSRVPHDQPYQRKSRSRSRERERERSQRKGDQIRYHRMNSGNRMSDSPEASSSRKRKNASVKPPKFKDRTPSSSDSEENNESRKMTKIDHSYSGSSDDSDNDKKAKRRKNFGLMMADGSKPVVKQKSVSKDNYTPVPSQAQKPVQSQRKEKLKLSDEEKERRRKEMMENANWRDKEREANVKKYRMEEDKEKEQLQRNFDEDFARKQFSRAADQTSVEGRIKSKLNTIQRSKRAMDNNFARR